MYCFIENCSNFVKVETTEESDMSLGGSEGAAVFKVTRQKLAIVLRNALIEHFFVYLHLLCSVFWIDKLK